MVAFCVHDEDDRVKSTTNTVATGNMFDLAIGSGAVSYALIRSYSERSRDSLTPVRSGTARSFGEMSGNGLDDKARHGGTCCGSRLGAWVHAHQQCTPIDRT